MIFCSSEAVSGWLSRSFSRVFFFLIDNLSLYHLPSAQINIRVLKDKNSWIKNHSCDTKHPSLCRQRFFVERRGLNILSTKCELPCSCVASEVASHTKIESA